jgi:tripeptide aminopeptidase
LNTERLLNDFFDLVRIKSPARNERAIADVLAARMAAMGMEVAEDDVGEKIGGNAGNLFGFLKGSVPDAPCLLLSVHMDTVEPCDNIKPQLKDGVITSDGTTILGADCKAGLAAIFEAVRVVLETGEPRGDIQLVITVAEEGGVNGSKHLDPARLRADLGFVLDTNGAPGLVVVQAPGKDRIDVVIHGKKAHAGIAPEKGVNAVALAGRALARLPMGRLDDETTINVGMISGGGATNVVPDRVEFSMETRSQNKTKLDFLTAQACLLIEEEAVRGGGRAEILMKRDYEPYALSEDAPQVALVRRAMASVGLTPVFKGTGGGSDANFFNSYGVPTAVLATGMTNVHTVEECILENDLYTLGKLALAIIRTAAGTRRGEPV